MKARELYACLMDWTLAHSGFEQRTYLGMSSISECPRVLYHHVTAGRTAPDDDAALRFYAGYLWERDVKARLQALGLYRPGSERELVAGFDSRFQGHTDGEVEGQLLEIKSTHQEKLERIVADGRLPESNFQQVQVYLHHGGYPSALVVFVARDTGRLHVVETRIVPAVAERLNVKARHVLADVDAGQPPACECGRCQRAGAQG